MKVKVAQVCAYANWPRESFEVWRWYPSNKSFRQVTKEMRSLFLQIYSHVAINKELEALKDAVFTIGMTYSEEKPVELSILPKLTEVLHFAWYLGHCLDMQRLQYFAPERVIVRGWVKVSEIENKEAYVLINSKQMADLSDSSDIIWELKKLLGNDPYKVEIDRLRWKLGLEWDYLFERKKRFKMIR